MVVTGKVCYIGDYEYEKTTDSLSRDLHADLCLSKRLCTTPMQELTEFKA